MLDIAKMCCLTLFSNLSFIFHKFCPPQYFITLNLSFKMKEIIKKIVLYK